MAPHHGVILLTFLFMFIICVDYSQYNYSLSKCMVYVKRLKAISIDRALYKYFYLLLLCSEFNVSDL